MQINNEVLQLNHSTELISRTPSLADRAPPGFPSKTLLFKASTETIHSRAEYFHKYLRVLNLDPQLANSYPLLSFLELNAIVQCLSVVRSIAFPHFIRLSLISFCRELYCMWNLLQATISNN